MSEEWSSLKLIQWTATYFEKAGIPNPRLDAELLLAHVLKCKRIDLYTRHEALLSEKHLADYKALIQRRTKREPLQYIVGETEFYGLRFKVTPAVLIPRPETELLVETVLSDRSDKSDRSDQILDIGTGSGCISVALAKNLPNAKITATDISKEALEIARTNADRHEVLDRIELIPADIAPWKRFVAEGRKFDLILSNPPYIAANALETLQAEVRDFEPRLALEGGPDGLTLIRKILDEAPPFLNPGGQLLMEIGDDQGKLVEALVRQHPELSFQGVKKDLNNRDRLAIFRKEAGILG